MTDPDPGHSVPTGRGSRTRRSYYEPGALGSRPRTSIIFAPLVIQPEPEPEAQPIPAHARLLPSDLRDEWTEDHPVKVGFADGGAPLFIPLRKALLLPPPSEGVTYRLVRHVEDAL